MLNKFCPQCGSSLNSEAEFCGKCGINIQVPLQSIMVPDTNQVASTLPPLKNRGGPRAWQKWGFRLTISGVLLILVASIVAVFTMMEEKKNDASHEVVAIVGRSLELHASWPEIVDRIAFVDDYGQHRIIWPRDSNWHLAAVDVAIRNRTNSVIRMSIGAGDAKLGDRRGEIIDALDPSELARVVETPDAVDPVVDKYLPFLWGEIELEKNAQVSGWMFFDVPKGLSLSTIWWGEVDSIAVDFVKYF